MLDDGQPQAGAAAHPGIRHIHAVEALRQAQQMLRRNADAAIRDFQQAAFGVRAPAHVDVAAFRAVLDGVGQQIGASAVQLLLNAQQADAGCRRTLDAVIFPSQAAQVGFRIGQQDVHIDRRQILRARRGAGFQPGQHQQIFHQGLHAAGWRIELVQQQAQFRSAQLGFLGGFQVAHHHGQGRAQFVGDIGNEILAHAQQPVDLSQIAHQDERPAAGHLEAAQFQALALGKGGGDLHGGFRRLFLQQRHRVRVPQQGAQAVARIAPVQMQNLLRRLIEGLDAAIRIHHHRGVRQRRGDRPKARQLLQRLLAPAPGTAQGAMQGFGRRAPRAGLRRRAAHGGLRPGGEALEHRMLMAQADQRGQKQRPAQGVQPPGADAQRGQQQGDAEQPFLAGVEAHQGTLKR